MSDLRSLLDRAAGDPPDLPDMDRIRRRGDVLRARRRLRAPPVQWPHPLWSAAALVAVRSSSTGSPCPAPGPP